MIENILFLFAYFVVAPISALDDHVQGAIAVAFLGAIVVISYWLIF